MEHQKFVPNQSGTCPHCQTGVRFEDVWVQNWRAETLISHWQLTSAVSFKNQDGSRPVEGKWKSYLAIAGCPECSGIILTHSNGTLLWPDAYGRPVPDEVKRHAQKLATDFSEAALVLTKSAKASAALSRRCLQIILVEKGGAKESDNLSKQIDDVLSNLPSELASNLDAIRHIGNFAAHPVKSTNSREIVDVEEGEAEWLLEIIEDLFDHYYVLPARSSARRDKLNQKLQTAGKPALKKP